MPRKPKAKNAISAGERARLYEAEMAEKQRRMHDLNVDESEPIDAMRDASEADATSVPPKTVEKSQNKPKKALLYICKMHYLCTRNA